MPGLDATRDPRRRGGGPGGDDPGPGDSGGEPGGDRGDVELPLIPYIARTAPAFALSDMLADRTPREIARGLVVPAKPPTELGEPAGEWTEARRPGLGLAKSIMDAGEREGVDDSSGPPWLSESCRTGDRG